MPTRPFRMIAITASAVAICGLVLTGCGRKGDIDPPSTPPEKMNRRTTDPTVPATPERPFVLDPLL